MAKSPLRTARELEDEMVKLRIEQNPQIGPVGDDELEKFRMEWRQEVKSRRPGQPKVQSKSQPQPQPQLLSPASPDKRVYPQPGPTSKGKEKNASKGEEKNLHEKPTTSPSTSPRAIKQPLSNHDASHGSKVSGTSRSPEKERVKFPKSIERRAGTKTSQEDAVSIYARAVEAEQGGQLNDALNLYRQAFRLDDNVDRAYSRRTKPLIEPTTLTPKDLVDSTPPEQIPFSFQRTIQTGPDYEKHHPVHHPEPQTHRSSPLTTLLNTTHPPAVDRVFEKQDDSLPMPIILLPNEMIDHILSHLDVKAIENFAGVSWKCRFLTACSEVWRYKVERIYKSPFINPLGIEMEEYRARYGGDWRSCLIEEERVRMDGCYIAVCHYVRPGAGDEWVAITHMITYHRFLRFYPDGTVISFLTTDHPSEVVPILKPSLRAKGLHLGRYTLIPPSSDQPDSPPHSQNQTHHPSLPGHKKKSRVLITELLEPGTHSPKYEFEMELSLRETGRGKWNKLDILDYRSINLVNGEVLGLVLKHQKPFYFSKVRSYQPTL